MNIQQVRSGGQIRYFSTDQAAARLGIKAQSLRAAICRDGAYFGVRPLKAPNRFLRWPADEIDRLLTGEAAR